jgi:hypothetical protein
MNLENVSVKIWNSVWWPVGNSVYASMWDFLRRDSVGNSVRDSVVVSVRDSVYNSVWDPVMDSVDIGLAAPIRQEREQA